MALNSFEKNGVTYFELYISCPVCLDRGNQTPHSYWSHHNNNCNGDIYMGENAFYYCKKCGATQHVYKWKYGCPNHSSGEYEFLEASPASLAQAVSTAGQMVNATGIPWLQTFLANMQKGC